MKNSRSIPLIHKSHRTFATAITFFIGLFVLRKDFPLRRLLGQTYATTAFPGDKFIA